MTITSMRRNNEGLQGRGWMGEKKGKAEAKESEWKRGREGETRVKEGEKTDRREVEKVSEGEKEGEREKERVVRQRVRENQLRHKCDKSV